MGKPNVSEGTVTAIDVSNETTTSTKADGSELLKGQLLSLDNLKRELDNLKADFEKAVKSGNRDKMLSVNSMLLKKQSDVSKLEAKIGPKTIQEIAEQENLLSLQKKRFEAEADLVMGALKTDCKDALQKHRNRYQDLFFLYRLKADATTKSKKIDSEVIVPFKNINGTVSETQQVRAYMQVVIRLEDKPKEKK